MEWTRLIELLNCNSESIHWLYTWLPAVYTLSQYCFNTLRMLLDTTLSGKTLRCPRLDSSSPSSDTQGNSYIWEVDVNAQHCGWMQAGVCVQRLHKLSKADLSFWCIALCVCNHGVLNSAILKFAWPTPKSLLRYCAMSNTYHTILGCLYYMLELQWSNIYRQRTTNQFFDHSLIIIWS